MLQVLPLAGSLLGEEAFRDALLEGLVISIGGLDGALSKSASAALINYVNPQHARGACSMPPCLASPVVN